MNFEDLNMLGILLCCMMKIVEFSTGTYPDRASHRKRRKKFIRRRKGKGMTEVGIVRGSPDSDCNSNHHGSASYLSNTSSQDIDFIQDNSDYQWFLDYGYRDGGTNHHTSILSLPESYEAGDHNYYDVFSKNMDANLAEADMESFKTEDIHALLTNLPPMCSDHLSQENNRQGECYASVSGSMMAKFDLESSISPHSSSQGEEYSANSNSMSICKSELLFSPLKETSVPVNFSVDSLDCDFDDMMLTCQANKDNYTIAFEGSVTMYSDNSDYPDTNNSSDSNAANTRSSRWHSDKAQKNNLKNLETSMTRSDTSSLTTWSKLKKRCSEDHIERQPSGNNNNSGDAASHLGLTDTTVKSQSMPNLHKQKLRSLLIASEFHKSQSNSSSDTNTVKRRPVKVFDIQNRNGSSGSVSDMATSVDASCSENINKKQPNFNLVKLFMKQKSMSVEGMSTTMDQLSSSENWPDSQSGESNSSGSKENLKMLNGSADIRTNDGSIKTYDLIAEEPEEDISRSESIDQVSESISETESVRGSFEKENIAPERGNSDDIGFVKPKNSGFPKTKKVDNILMNRSIQTSNFSEITNLKNANRTMSPKATQPIRISEPSFLSKLKTEGEGEKAVYVLYPNYVLPDLDFLNEKEDISKLLFVPQKAPNTVTNKRRPFSCNDIETLKKRGFDHVQDWESLTFLLPREYRKILSNVPGVSEHIKQNSKEKPSFVRQQTNKRRPLSFESSSSSTATQPSSGYRGSSSLLADSQNSPLPAANLNPLFVYRYDSVTSSEASLMNSERQRSITTTPSLPLRCVSLPQGDSLPPRPPLPRGILRRAMDKIDTTKRYSMYETSEEEIIEDPVYKRKSLPEPYFLQRNKRFSETEDEGVDAGTSSSSLDEHPDHISHHKADHLLSHISTEELTQLDEFLKLSGISTSDHDESSEKSFSQLKSYVNKFLSLKINQEGGEHFGGKKCVSFAEKVKLLPKHLEPKQFHPPNNSPNVSAFLHHRNCQAKTLVDLPISEENENSPNYSSPQTTPIHLSKTLSDNLIQKRSLISAVAESVEHLMHHFSLASNQTELNALGDSNINPACAKLALTTLCPALYAVLSDGLKPSIETSFGAIHNSVWQVVEASAQQGPLTKALNELVMRINSEDAITEGLVKFNAFIFGLLNVRSLDAWASFLRTRESILRRHYTGDSLMVMTHTGGAKVRSLLDAMIAALQPLAFIPFQLDLLFEYKQLHMSFKRMDSFHKQLSPICKHSTSPNFKQFNSKIGHSSHSNRSNSESDDISTANTVRHISINNESHPSDSQIPSPQKSTNRSNKERPRSCVESSGSTKLSFKLGDDVNRKRWSGISLTSKLYQAYDRLSKEDEEYTDSLENQTCQDETNRSNSNENVPSLIKEDCEPESLDSNFSDEKPLNGRRFKKLQQKWEMLSGQNSTESPPTSPTHGAKSKIPRPITSPVKPSSIPVPVGLLAGNNKTVKKVTTPPGCRAGLAVFKGMNSVKSSPNKKAGATTRTSRVDQLDHPSDAPRHAQRPSSLPYKAAPQNGKASKITPPRRAASSSLNRKPVCGTPLPKVVRTLNHRVPSESGHLSYSEGERLRVVLEVDSKWLLCCRGTQKGLVPKSAVIAETGFPLIVKKGKFGHLFLAGRRIV